MNEYTGPVVVPAWVCVACDEVWFEKGLADECCAE